MKILISLLLMSIGAFAQIDPNATVETKKLRKKLNDISLSIGKNKQKILLGQQNALTEGQNFRLNDSNINEKLRSDMHDAVGVHPAVVGYDFSEFNSGNTKLISQQMREIHKRGGVVTLSWHANTVVKDGIGNNWSHDVSTPVIKYILPGARHHKAFLVDLNSLADFLLSVKDVPIVFRPWHEHNFSWFWWGNTLCTETEFISLWRMTVEHLKSRGVHNLLYAYSPISIGSYFHKYPGDNYVDIFGIDHFYKGHAFDRVLYSLSSPLLDWKKSLVELSQAAVEHDKIPAVTEFGLEGCSYNQYWTDYVSWPMEKDGMATITGPDNIPKKAPAFIIIWRNSPDNRRKYYGPIPGHRNNDNFKLMMSKKIFQGL